MQSKFYLHVDDALRPRLATAPRADSPTELIPGQPNGSSRIDFEEKQMEVILFFVFFLNDFT